MGACAWDNFHANQTDRGLYEANPMNSTIYSERLGPITDEQFAAAASRLGLGVFQSATPTSAGMFGQNVFIRTTQGEFVLRGAPHWVKGPGETDYRPQDRWQFAKEAFFARLLHERTAAPAPWPYLLDEASDIFGWPYAVMPRMPGACYDERSVPEALAPQDRRDVAAAMGSMLAEMQTLTSPFARRCRHNRADPRSGWLRRVRDHPDARLRRQRRGQWRHDRRRSGLD